MTRADEADPDPAIEIDPERFRESFERYSAVGATEAGGLHRLALSEADREVRDRFVADLRDLGLSVRVDEVGNVFGRRPGTDPDAAPVLVGSHLDSQPYGGRYDGQLGVLSALETLRAFEDAGVETARPVEIVNWTNEEGSRFEHAMTGSAAYTGVLSVAEAHALTDDDGVTLREALETVGYLGDEPCEAGEIHAALELHVEQGPKLARRGTSVGVVDGVFGMAWLEATVRGEADHAGPTTMDARSDALAAAMAAGDRIHTLPNRLSADAVATVGRIDAEPDSVNVIPDEATFSVDVRSYDDDVVDRAVEAVEFEVETACEREGTTYDLSELWRIPHTEFSERVRSAADAAAARAGVGHDHVVSGAGHDAVYLNDVTDAGMLFVPSVDGKTHNEAEFTEWDDCVAGARLFAETTYELAA